MDALPLSGVAQLGTVACLLASVHVYHNGVPTSQGLARISATLTTGLIPFIFGTAWLRLVTKSVPEPYLDEVFHIPQAQVYCEGRYRDWDDKITTPPGLYLLSIWLIQGTACTAESLRMVNVGIVSCIAIVSAICFSLQRRRQTIAHSLNTFWAGTNIALFPVIFFFSGLYYTDGASTLVVLLAYWAHLVRAQQAKPSIVSDLATIVVGLASLLMRQTNIFWVVVFMGGLETVNAVKNLRPEKASRPKSNALVDQAEFHAWRYSVGDIHDPSLDVATPIVDVALCAVSLIIAGTCNILPILQRIWPHLTVLAAFVGFVVWNGGVVLGDKSNHVATLHLAQMLYIWPLLVFFSAPLFILPVVQLIRHAWTTLAQTKQANEKSKPPVAPPRGTLITSLATSHLVQAAVVLTAFVAVAAAIVRFSTIIHPFTLADNRHYMFYVFRYSILRAWWVRFALVPVYVVCAWLCWVALQGRWLGAADAAEGRRWECSPWDHGGEVSAANDKHGTAASAQPARTDGANMAVQADSSAPSTSTVLILLVATTLSLMTAPLVEPRYFILPWLFWRLLVPAWPLPTTGTGSSNAATDGRVSKLRPAASSAWWHVDAQIVLETLWFAAINVATMYIFLTRPFYWRAPDGSLADGGRVQRFMW
ncbi:DIE2/ALG10 family-domain-containing protein [Microdochium bolleyi]|uniref:Dol-P-Glc:Glc(2)Man(9)GlcNAc(2)-PP-Dol alpha-1,2-glucosyltransferase n=1 Tax=Microdochium bolleyi TaxID=196109 RepID=A0A136ITS6_9PEZI|nr:DIE2/ALG10 family-domain-containing protein [Microdochium bolleyi]